MHQGVGGMSEKDIALMAHLMRRAGFGASREELERRVANGYEATVEELLHPESQPPWDEDLARRHHIGARYGNGLPETQGWWLQRMVSTQRPLEEKMTLFWHSILCTGNAKVDHPQTVQVQIEMLRKHCLGNYRDLLGGPRPGSRHDHLPRQPRQPQGRHQRKLGPRAPGALLHGRR